jgi:large subunit ribosomal protein L22
LTVPETDTRQTPTRQTVARLRHMRTSPTKIRPVLQLITGKDIGSARDTLRLSERAVSHDVGKLLDSAVANAEHNDNIPEDELYVAKAYADEGPTMKRWRPRARGRGTRIRKRTTHLTIVVARYGEEQLDALRRGDAGTTTRGPRRGPARRRPRREAEHDHDHDHEHDDVAEDAEAADAAPAKKSTAKKSTAKKSSTSKKAGTTAKKSTAKKTAKTTTKKATKATKATKKTTKKAGPTKKSQDD